MSEATQVSHPIYGLLPADVEGFESLVELALDMRWTWNHATDEVWRQRAGRIRGIALIDAQIARSYNRGPDVLARC